MNRAALLSKAHRLEARARSLPERETIERNTLLRCAAAIRRQVRRETQHEETA